MKKGSDQKGQKMAYFNVATTNRVGQFFVRTYCVVRGYTEYFQNKSLWHPVTSTYFKHFQDTK